jgi:hypothetical protein
LGVSAPNSFCHSALISGIGSSGKRAICARTDGGVAGMRGDVFIMTPVYFLLTGCE